MEELAQTLHFIVWGPWTLALFLGTGIWFTCRSGAFQLRRLPYWMRETVGNLGNPVEGKEEGRTSCGSGTKEGWALRGNGTGENTGVTPFQSACTALAATIGTGNIVGVATALTAGGPGALFWMWVSAAIGMMTAYAETSLGQRYRYRQADGHWMCGPMVYMERGLKCRPLGILYACFALMASLGMGSMVQSNSMSGTLAFGAGIPVWLSGIGITVLVALVVLGGIGRIAKVAERLMPVSAGIYLVFSGVVVLSCWRVLPAVVGEIFSGAFQPSAVGGGAAGFLLSRSVRYGMSRGVFSNEAGLGSLAVLHGAAEDTTPEKQGMWAMFEVFFDTVVVCTLTALVILCIWQSEGIASGQDGAALTAYCFSRRLGGLGEVLVSAAMVVFAFATIIAWYYLGRQTLGYLVKSGQAGHFYTVLYLAAVFLGCVSRLDVVWMISDLWNGLMAYPNLLTLWILSGQVQFPRPAR